MFGLVAWIPLTKMLGFNPSEGLASPSLIFTNVYHLRLGELRSQGCIFRTEEPLNPENHRVDRHFFSLHIWMIYLHLDDFLW